VQLTKHPFSKQAFTKLFRTYVGDYGKVADFYTANPVDSTDVKRRAASLHFKGRRERSAALLKSFNEQFEAHKAAFENIERLKQPDSLAVVTGQQLGLYGGPVFTMFKTLSAIHLARCWENILSRPVIPIFWLADEDHDYEEVRSVSVLNSEGVKSYSLPMPQEKGFAVSKMRLPDDIEALRSSLRSTLIETEFSDDLWSLLDKCFKPGATFLEAFGGFMAQLFSKHGLVLAGSHHPAIKKELKDPLITGVKKVDAIQEALESQSQRIEQSFHRQAAVLDSHLFYHHPEKGRLKVEHEEGRWKAGAGQQWSSDALADEINGHPERFSPDVFLRPILQDQLLPTLGYIAGPGELAYYGQMKAFYRCFGRQMPVIFPRLSATFIEPAIGRILQELPFDIQEYHSRIEDLESEFVERTGEIDIEAVFDSWKEEEASIAASHIEEIAAVDETLKGAAENARATYLNELNKLKGKVYRAVKKRKAIQLGRIQRIRQNLFPDGELQERTLGGIYYMNKYGPDIWDRLLDELKEPAFNKRRLIYL
jgi:bacillithiol biosynthesis cysteine-adding enzyme BshC